MKGHLPWARRPHGTVQMGHYGSDKPDRATRFDPHEALHERRTDEQLAGLLEETLARHRAAPPRGYPQ